MGSDWGEIRPEADLYRLRNKESGPHVVLMFKNYLGKENAETVGEEPGAPHRGTGEGGSMAGLPGSIRGARRRGLAD